MPELEEPVIDLRGLALIADIAKERSRDRLAANKLELEAQHWRQQYDLGEQRHQFDIDKLKQQADIAAAGLDLRAQVADVNAQLAGERLEQANRRIGDMEVLGMMKQETANAKEQRLLDQTKDAIKAEREDTSRVIDFQNKLTDLTSKKGTKENLRDIYNLGQEFSDVINDKGSQVSVAYNRALSQSQALWNTNKKVWDQKVSQEGVSPQQFDPTNREAITKVVDKQGKIQKYFLPITDPTGKDPREIFIHDPSDPRKVYPAKGHYQSWTPKEFNDNVRNWEEFYGEGASTVQEPTAQVPVITSQAEYNALPSKTPFIWNGRRGIKP